MATLRYSAVIKLQGINPYVLVSATRAHTLKPGWRKPLPVLVRINGKPNKAWHINMMPTGKGSFYLYLHGSVRKTSTTKVGDKVNVAIEFDSEYRNGPMHEMPPPFRKSLLKNLKANAAWKALSPSRKKEILRYFANLKSKEAKTRNIERAICVLSGKPGRFMGRSWVNGV